MTTSPFQTICNVSGGKDSTALYLLALEKGVEFRAVFADTGHEHPATLDFVNTLSSKTGGPDVETVRADFLSRFPKKRATIANEWPRQGVDGSVVERALLHCRPTGNPFLDICILMSGFPSIRVRFCTTRLKIKPIEQQVYAPLLLAGVGVESWQGVRREESLARRDLEPRQTLAPPARCGNKSAAELSVYRPLLDWTITDVWRMHRRHGIEPNPLYAAGASRVGCMPCIAARKMDIRTIAERHPAEIERVAEWERVVGLASKNAISRATFFHAKDHGGPGGIHAAVDWSRTVRGGKTYDLIPLESVRADLGTACGEWGACE